MKAHGVVKRLFRDFKDEKEQAQRGGVSDHIRLRDVDSAY